MKKSVLLLLLLVLFSAEFSRGQISPPNQAGVSMGMLETYIPDVDADKNFWIALGGTLVPVTTAHYPGNAVIVKFPSVLITMRKDTRPGTEGSVVDHVGFTVRNVGESMAKWKAAALKTEPGKNAKQIFLTTPDGLIKIEISENRSLSVPIAFTHIYFAVSESGSGGKATPSEMQDWYVKVLGAKQGKRSNSQADADVAGVTLTFTKFDTPTAPSKGRALDRINFEVKGEEAFCKKLEAGGVKLDRPCVQLPNGNWAGFLTDPGGTNVELNEGLTLM